MKIDPTHIVWGAELDQAEAMLRDAVAVDIDGHLDLFSRLVDAKDGTKELECTETEWKHVISMALLALSKALHLSEEIIKEQFDVN